LFFFLFANIFTLFEIILKIIIMGWSI